MARATRKSGSRYSSCVTDSLTPVSLGTWPTPMEPMPRLARALGLRPQELWIKRDDLTGLAGGGNKIRKLEWTVAAALADALRSDGRKPYLIPFGGSSALSIRGYHTAGLEILAQQPEALTVVTAVGSGGTMAGLVTALGPHRVLGVSAGAVTDARAAVATLLRDGGWPVNELRVDDRHIGAGYATLTDATRHAIELAARTEGIILDPIYSGRAMAGLVAAVRGGEILPVGVVFVHTGGLPGLFGHGWSPSPSRSPE